MNEIVKEDEWLKVILVGSKPKTNIYEVISKCSDCLLGIIKWYPSWRHYCFFPTIEIETVYSDRCLISIGEFITDLNKQHKEKKK